MSLIDQYIESLVRHLGRNAAQAKEQVAEIRTHLEMDARDRADAGLSPAEAEQAACKAMGSPQVIANQMIRQARGYATASAWRLAWPCGVALALAMVVPYSLLGNIHYQATADTLVRWAPFLALLFFGGRVIQTKRWLVKPMAAWAALATVGLLVGNTWVISNSQPPAQPQGGVASMELADVVKEQALVDAWRSGNPPMNKAPLAGVADSSTVVPFLPFAIGGMDRTMSLEDSSPAEAVARWNKYGATYAADVHYRKQYLESALKRPARQAWSKSEMTINMLKIGLLFTAYQILVFLIVNAGILALIGFSEKKKARREPLFA